MSEQINAGDIVMMVSTPNDLLCEHAKALFRMVFQVSDISITPTLSCERCGYVWSNVKVASFAGVDNLRALRLLWLKKIPPLSEPETVEYKEEMPA